MIEGQGDYRNKLNRLGLGLGLLVFLIDLAYSITLGKGYLILIGLLLGGLFLAVSIYSTIGRTPKIVRIGGNEIILYSYFGYSQRIALKDIEFVYLYPPNPQSWWKRNLVGGYFKKKDGRLHVITYEIGQAIKIAYFQAYGKNPPIRMESRQTYRRIGIRNT